MHYLPIHPLIFQLAWLKEPVLSVGFSDEESLLEW